MLCVTNADFSLLQHHNAPNTSSLAPVQAQGEFHEQGSLATCCQTITRNPLATPHGRRAEAACQAPAPPTRAIESPTV